MRYPDGGGLSPTARERRETVRMQAARLFAEDVAPVQVAARLRVSTKSVYQWRRRWRAGGERALASTGPGGARCRLSDAQLHRLRTELARGPAEHGWADQRWTLARVATVIGRLFHLRYTPRGTAYLLHRLGWSAQMPRHRAVQRTADAIAAWRTLTGAKVRG
jgi:transposase